MESVLGLTNNRERGRGSAWSSRDGEFAMFDTPQAQNPIGQAFDFAAVPFQDDYFETMMVIQMNMRRRQNLAGSSVLSLDQLGRKIRLVVVVDHGQGSHDHFVLLSCFLYQVLAD